VIRDAASAILADNGYSERARDFAQRASQPDGAQSAADELLTLLDDPSQA
jgi:hypothetical protein